jgi:DNA polymerase-1
MEKLLLIDTNGLIHRAYHALPPLTTPDGRPTGALYGLARLLVKALADERPTHVAACFDRPEPTFRKVRYAEYKAHRPPAPDDLMQQIVEARELIEKFHILVVELPGYEADDLIGTLAAKFASPERQVVILTGDLDSLQLVRDGLVTVASMKTGVSELVRYTEEKVRERFGVRPDQLADYKGLAGDASDNIPGVRGVGPKTAAQLLTEFGTLEKIFSLMPPEHRLAKKVLPHREAALLSRDLGRIATDAPIPITLEKLEYRITDPDGLRTYLLNMGFESIAKKMEQAQPETWSENPGTARTERVLTILNATHATSLGTALASDTVKIAFSWKPILRSLSETRWPNEPLFDLSIAGWLLDSDHGDYSPESLMTRYLPKKGSGVAPEAAARDLYVVLASELEQAGLANLARKLEFPLIRVLARMEQHGILVDQPALEALKGVLVETTNELSRTIHAMAGTTFNLQSPRQVGEVLFGTLGLHQGKVKKTKTGQYRTSAGVLETLREAHPVVPLLLAYREHTKVLTGFVEPFLSLIEADGRIHTTLLQTATGRIASEKPNLQNIPKESEWAIPIRNTFVASRGFRFVSFDYSQIELRILAHITKDPGLLTAFRDGVDIHTATASRVFGITTDRVTPELRRVGKTLNFGVIYGMGAKAFAETSGIAIHEARRRIEEYFAAFPTVRDWQESVKHEAMKHGMVLNEHGRRRVFSSACAFGEFERAAVNMPIQSLQADLLKQAMLDTTTALVEHGWYPHQARLLLSIHDELLFEIADAIVEESVPILARTMEHAANLSLPVTVEVSIGSSWGSLAPYHTAR